MLATVDSTGYKVLLIVHVLAIVVAFGVNFVTPILSRASDALAPSFAKIAKTLQLPSLAIAFVAGMGLIGMSDDQWKMSQAWVSIAFVVVIAAAVVVFLLARAHETGAKTVPMLNGILHLLLLVGLYAMIFKPGH